MEKEIWSALRKHLDSVFKNDSKTYAKTTGEDLSLYEWWETPHRQDGLDVHLFCIENAWAGKGGKWHYDFLEPKLQIYGNTAIASYTMMITRVEKTGITRKVHNESRVLVKQSGQWKVVHVHKSPAWRASYMESSE